MSQIHTVYPAGASATTAPSPKRTGTSRQEVWWVDAIIVVIVVAAIFSLIVAASHWVAPLTPTASIDLSPRSLPLYAGLSTLRMALAYVLSLVFTLVYARVAAARRGAERVMIPLLDILQSIPILSFLPGVELALLALFPHSFVGLELSAILLIFTSQAWNMTFSFYHSLLVIPKDLREAASIYQLNYWRRFRLLEVPFAMIPLIWNSMMSWAGGWFFLMAAEQFTVGTRNVPLPGLGSYLQAAANAGDVGALLLGLGTLIVVIVLLDQFLWRPLIAWADRFKVEQTASGEAPTSFVLRGFQRSAIVKWTSHEVLLPASERLDRQLSRFLPVAASAPARMALGSTAPESPERAPAIRGAAADKAPSVPRVPRGRVLAWAVGALVLAACIWETLLAVRVLFTLPPAQWGTIFLSALATLLRTAAALLIGVAWTVPVGVAIGLNPKLAQRAQPIVQVVASVPATAIFPALLLVLLALPGGLNIAAVGLMLLGTQWYILFNVIAGAMAIPTDLREAAATYKLRGWQRWRLLLLPGIFPYLVTGLITASGGAWNASIVSEYVSFSGHVYSTVGLGALIAGSVATTPPNYALLFASTLTMAAVVVAINRLLWKRLYRLAEQRFHLD
jgi:NitT/TauT family transport system permease protein